MYGPGLAPPHSARPSAARLVALRVVFVLMILLSFGFLAWGALLRVATITRKKSDWTLFWGQVVLEVVITVLLVSDDTDDFSSWQGNMGMTLLLLSAFAVMAYYLYTDIRHYQTQAWPGPVGMGGPVMAGGAGYTPHPVVHQHPPQGGYGYPPQLQPQPVSQQQPQPQGQPQPHMQQPGQGNGHQVLSTSGPQPAGPGPSRPDPFAVAQPPAGTHGLTGASHAFGAPGEHVPSTNPGPPPVPSSGARPFGGPLPVSSPPPVHARIDEVRAELDELSDYLRRQGDGAASGGGTQNGGPSDGRNGGQAPGSGRAGHGGPGDAGRDAEGRW